MLKGINRDKPVVIALALFDLCYTHTISHTLPYIPCTPSDLRGRVAFGHSLTIQTRLRLPVALGGKIYQINSDNRYQIGIFMQISDISPYFWANRLIDHGSNWRPAHILYFFHIYLSSRELRNVCVCLWVLPEPENRCCVFLV